MPATVVILAVSLLRLVVCAETVFIGLLLLLLVRIAIVSGRRLWQREQAREERDEAQRLSAVILRISEIRMETVAKLRGFPQ